jgi:hypothetical protein
VLSLPRSKLFLWDITVCTEVCFSISCWLTFSSEHKAAGTYLQATWHKILGDSNFHITCLENRRSHSHYFHWLACKTDTEFTVQVYSSMFWRLSEWRLYSPQQVHLSSGLQEEEHAFQHMYTTLPTGLPAWWLYCTRCLHVSYWSVIPPCTVQ